MMPGLLLAPLMSSPVNLNLYITGARLWCAPAGVSARVDTNTVVSVAIAYKRGCHCAVYEALYEACSSRDLFFIFIARCFA